MVLNNCVNWTMCPSDEQIEFSDQESYTLVLVAGGILYVNRSVYTLNWFNERFQVMTM